MDKSKVLFDIANLHACTTHSCRTIEYFISDNSCAHVKIQHIELIFGMTVFNIKFLDDCYLYTEMLNRFQLLLLNRGRIYLFRLNLLCI